MNSMETRRNRRQRSMARMTFVEYFVLAVVIVFCIAALVLPAVQQARSGVGSPPAIYNLKKISLAEHNYLSENDGRFTSPTLNNDRGQAVHSWYTLLLPYMDEAERFDRIDLERRWNDPVNAKLFRTPTQSQFELIPKIDPKETPDGWPVIHYSMNSRLRADDHRLTIDDVTRGDGSTNTLMFGQISAGLPPWGKPGNARDFTLGLKADAFTFGWKKYGVTVVARCDGSVTTINNDIDPRVLKSLAIWNDERQPMPE